MKIVECINVDYELSDVIDSILVSIPFIVYEETL